MSVKAGDRYQLMREWVYTINYVKNGSVYFTRCADDSNTVFSYSLDDFTSLIDEGRLIKLYGINDFCTEIEDLQIVYSEQFSINVIIFLYRLMLSYTYIMPIFQTNKLQASSSYTQVTTSSTPSLTP